MLVILIIRLMPELRQQLLRFVTGRSGLRIWGNLAWLGRAWSVVIVFALCLILWLGWNVISPW